MRRSELAGIMVVAAALSGCGGRAPPPAPKPPPPEVTIVQPVVRTISDLIELPGRTAAVETVQVRARVGGHLKRVAFTEGSEIARGDLLFEIDPAPFRAALAQAQAAQRAVEAKLLTQQRELARFRALVAQGFISRMQVDVSAGSAAELVANREAARAVVERARLELSWTRITAPIAGQVGRALVTPGNVVVANQTVLTSLVSVDPIHAFFEADEQTVLRVQRMIRERRHTSFRDARLPVFLGLSSEQGFPHEGAMDFVDNALDPSTGTLTGRAVFSNPDRALTPGLFVRVRLPVGRPRDALLVPSVAVNLDQRGEYLKVVGPGNVVRDQVVTTGRSEEGLTVIERGLTAADRVVARGLQRARAGAPVRVREEQVAAFAVPPSPPSAAPGEPLPPPPLTRALGAPLPPVTRTPDASGARVTPSLAEALVPAQIQRDGTRKAFRRKALTRSRHARHEGKP